MPIKISQDELDGILSEVETSVGPILKSEVDKLKKASEESGGSPSASPGGEASGSPSGPPADDGSGSAPPAGPDASASAPPAGGPPMDGPPSPSPAGPPSPSPSPAGAMDPAMLMQAIDTMNPDQLKAMYMAVKQKLFAAQGAGPSAPPAGPDASAIPPSPSPAAPPAGPPMGGPPMGSPPAGPPMDGPPVPPVVKNEMKPSPGNGGKTAPVQKSEDQKKIADLENQVKAAREETALLTKAVQAIAKTPLRKSVTSVTAAGIAPPEPDLKPMTKSELNARLKDAIQSGKLTKKQRENTTRFYDTGSVNLELVKDVLTLKL